MAIAYKETPYGFDYGSATVTRIASDEKKGWVVICVQSQKAAVQVYVTKTGKMRVFQGGVELKRVAVEVE